MIEISRLSLIIFGELLIGMIILSVILLGMLVTRRGKIHKAAQHLVERIQSDKVARVKRLRNRLADDYLYEGEKLEQAVHDLTQVEMRLYQNVINSYLKQDVVEFQQTDVDVENLVIAYQGLDLPDAGAAQEDGEGINDAHAEIERLKDENSRLSDELKVTMDTMGRMLNEYSSMFAGGAETDFDKVQVADEPANGEEPYEPEDTGLDASGDFTSDDHATSMAPESAADDQLEPSTGGDSDQLDDSIVAQPEQAEPAAVESMSDLDIIALNQEGESVDMDNSMLDDLAGVDIEIPDAQELGEAATPESGSLEEEWAQLLAEDAESPAPMLETDAVESDVDRKQDST